MDYVCFLGEFIDVLAVVAHLTSLLLSAHALLLAAGHVPLVFQRHGELPKRQ